MYSFIAVYAGSFFKVWAWAGITQLIYSQLFRSVDIGALINVGDYVRRAMLAGGNFVESYFDSAFRLIHYCSETYELALLFVPHTHVRTIPKVCQSGERS